MKDKKELDKFLKENKNNIKSISLNITTYYNKTFTRCYGECYYRIHTKDDNNYIYGSITEYAGGGGYDRESTAFSNCTNHFTEYLPIKKDNNKPYGLYENNHISYGIGNDAVLQCLKYLGFNIKREYCGKLENNYLMEVEL